jgi:hypothetical protein
MMKGKITQNEEMFNMYDKVLMDWEKQGMVSRVEDYEPRRIGTYYHPHFGVFKMVRETYKCRPVFDSASICEGASANDHILKGPVLNI